MQTGVLLALMTALQVLWLVSVWWTGAAAVWWKPWVLSGFSIVCAAVVVSVPAGAWSQVRHGIGRLIRDNRSCLLAFILPVMGIGGVYAWYQQGWPDEPRVFDAARMLTEVGVRQFFGDYAQVPHFGRQHPPLTVLLYGTTLAVFGVNVFFLRGVSLLFSLGTVFLTYRIGARLYTPRLGILAALLFLSIPFFFRIGATALLDMPVTFFFVLAVFWTLCLLEKPSLGLTVGIGLCIGAGLLCKYTMVFIYPVLLGFWGIAGWNRRLLPFLVLIGLISLSLLMVWLGYAATHGLLAPQENTVLSYAGFVMKTNVGKMWLLEVLVLRLPSGIGVQNLPLLLLGGWVLSRRRGQSDQYLLIWMVLVFLPVALTLPGPRYFLPTFPALAIAMACGLERVRERQEQVVILSLLLGGSTLYLFVDWYRAAGGWFSH